MNITLALNQVNVCRKETVSTFRQHCEPRSSKSMIYLQQLRSSCPQGQSTLPSQRCACEMQRWFPQCTSPLRLHTRQLSSSDRSAQSTWPSHRQSCGIQRRTSHWNPVGQTADNSHLYYCRNNHEIREQWEYIDLSDKET